MRVDSQLKRRRVIDQFIAKGKDPRVNLPIAGDQFAQKDTRN